MKITIDTKEDSHEELRKVIKMLSSLVGEEVMSNQGDMFGDSSQQSSDMFSDDSSKTETSESSGGGVFNMFNSGSGSAGDTTEETTEEKKEEPDIDIPEVEEYR